MPGRSFHQIDDDHDIKQAINEIADRYGDTVSVDQKKKSLLKHGWNPNVGTSDATIWYTGQDQASETYVAANTNSIDSISSSSTSDTMSVVIEGHTESGGNKTFVTQSATLNGRTRVALTTPLNRITRVYNDGATDLVGPVYVYENTSLTTGKPTDTTKIHLTIPPGRNQSEKASTSFSSTDYWIVTNFYGWNDTKTGSNSVSIRLEIRKNGKTFRSFAEIAFSTGGGADLGFDPYIIVPKNADVRLRAIASGASQSVIGGIQGYLAKVV